MMNRLKTALCILIILFAGCSHVLKQATEPLIKSGSSGFAETLPDKKREVLLYSNNLMGTLDDVLNTISKELKICIQLSLYAKENKVMVKGKFKDIPLTDVIDFLTEQAECDFVFLDYGCCFVDKQDSKKLSQTVTIITAKGTNFFLPLIPEEWKKYVKKAGEQNFVITAPARTIRMIEKWFADIDTPPQQILLNGYIVAVSAQEFRELGTTFGTNGILSMSGANKGKWVGNYSITDFAKFLEGNKDIYTCALHSVMALEGEEADMKKTGEQHILLAGDKDRYAQIGKIPIETYLHAKVNVCPEGILRIVVKGQISQQSSNDSGGNILAETSGDYASTTILVKNGKIGLIGLMTGEKKQKLVKHIPILGRIPFLPIGRHEEVVNEDVVFLFLINPQIVEANEFNPAFLRRSEKEKGGEVKKNTKQKK